MSKKVGSGSGDEFEEDNSSPDRNVLPKNFLNKTIQSYPPNIKRRVKALKNLQLETTNIEANFFKEVHELECKYQLQFNPFFLKRHEIVAGFYEPKDEECIFPSDDEAANGSEVDGLVTDALKALQVGEKPEDAAKKEEDSSQWGIPDFWLTVFKNVSVLDEMVQSHDEPILKHLVDVRVIFGKDPIGFNLEFHFSINDYFKNTVLTKEYIMKCTPDPLDPFSFEGPEIIRCKGCVIDWYKGMNVTIKTVKKKQKQKGKGAVRYVQKTVQNDSFFNFFNPPVVNEDDSACIDEDTMALLTSDFEIGHFFKDRVVPKAVLFFTGEAVDDEDYEEEEEDEDEEDDEEDEENPPPPAIFPGHKNRNSGLPSKKPEPFAKNSNVDGECKQQ